MNTPHLQFRPAGWSGCRATAPVAMAGLTVSSAIPKPGTRNLQRRASRAFSLIEVALSIAIIGMGLVAILGVMPTLLMSSRGAVEQTEIAMAAQNSVDMDFASLRTPDDLVGFSGTTGEIYTGPSLVASNTIRYAAATNAMAGTEFKDANNKPLLRTVRYTYSWPPNSPRAQTYTFVTEICATTNIVMGP